MPTCFVIQPFDKSKFDKRYLDVFKPAIEQCALDAYRVDEDPSADIPIDAIEKGIRESAICLADITLDNPNVWYELGFAIASQKPVIMVCASDRGSKFPFDVQHRNIIRYDSDSSSDFSSLQSKIVARLEATLSKTESLRVVASSPQLSIEGLSQSELIVLAALAGNLDHPSDNVPTSTLKRDVEASGFTAFAFSVGIKQLLDKELIRYDAAKNTNLDEWIGYELTRTGWQWVLAHQGTFTIRQQLTREDDVPF